MPGPISDPYPGPSDAKPAPPRWAFPHLTGEEAVTVDLVRIPIPEGESYRAEWERGALVIYQGDCYRIVDVELDSPPPGWPPGPCAVLAQRVVRRSHD